MNMGTGMTMPQPMYGMQQPLMMGGVVYNQQRPVQMTTGLTHQRIQEKLKEGGGAFKMAITAEEMEKAVCCHRDNNQGYLVSTNNPDRPNEYRCTICGEVFNLLEGITPQDVSNGVADMHDILNTIKVMYVDMPPQLINEIFQILPIIDRIDKLYNISADRFNQFIGNTPQQGQYMNNTINGFQGYNMMMNGMTGMAPMMNGMVQQPMQPVMNNGMQMAGQQVQPMVNGIVQQYTQPMMAGVQAGMVQQPVMNNGMVQPMQTVMTPMQQQMTAQAPGLNTGFGYVTQPMQTTVQGQTVTQPAATEENKQTTKTLQA